MRTSRIHTTAGFSEGGMGIVYRAIQKRPERIVALKVLKGPLSSGRVAERFEREIGILARLHHRGIPQLFCVGKIDQGVAGQTPFMAMEYIEGEDICSFADRNHLAASDRVGLVAQVCDAVAYAHHHGVIHRDLKPANILVDQDGETKVLDFGLAALKNPIPPCTPLTQDGDCLGTLDYVSPEQANGALGAIDERTDVYALGIILFELLTGAPPYKLAGSSWSEAARLLLDSRPVLLSRYDRTLRGDIETIVLKAMSRDKAMRYVSAAALAADLRRFLVNRPIHAKRPTRAYLFRKFIQRNQRLAAVAAMVFVSLCLALAFTVRAERRATAEKYIAEVRLAQAHLAEGDGLFLSENYTDARQFYEQARSEYQRMGVSTMAADAALWELNTKAAVPLETLCCVPHDVIYAALSTSEGKVALVHIDGRLEILSLIDRSSKVSASRNRPIAGLKMSPDGHHLLVLYEDCFQIRDLVTNQPLQSVSLHAPGVAASISDTLAIEATTDGVVCCAIDGRKVVPSFHTTGGVKAVQLAGESLLVDDDNGLVTCEANDITHAIGTLSKYHSARFCRDGSMIAVQEGRQCRILECGNQLQEIAKFDLPKSSDLIEFSDSKHVVTINRSGHAESIVDLAGRVLWQVPEFPAHYPGIFGKLAVSDDADGRCVLWAIAGETSVKQLIPAQDNPRALALSGDGQLAAVAVKDGLVRLIDTSSGASFEVPNSYPASDLAFCGKDEFLAISQLHSAMVWDVLSHRCVATFTFPKLAMGMVGDTTYPQCYARIGDGSVVEIANRDGIWNQRLVPSDLISDAIDSDGHGHLCLNNTHAGEIWETQPELRRKATLKPENDLVRNLAFVRDGEELVAQDVLAHIEGWSASGTPLGNLQTLSMHSSVISGSAGPAVFIRQLDQIVMWDASTAAIVRRLPIGCTRIAISRNGRTALVGTHRDGVSLLLFDGAERLRAACSILTDDGRKNDRAARRQAYDVLELGIHGW